MNARALKALSDVCPSDRTIGNPGEAFLNCVIDLTLPIATENLFLGTRDLAHLHKVLGYILPLKEKMQTKKNGNGMGTMLTSWLYCVTSAILDVPAHILQQQASQSQSIQSKNGATSGFEICFGPSTLGAGAKHVSNPA